MVGLSQTYQEDDSVFLLSSPHMSVNIWEMWLLMWSNVCLLSLSHPVCSWWGHLTREVEQAGLSDLEIISQPVEDEDQCLARPVQLVSFGYRDLPLAALDLSLAGSQLLSNTDEDENRDGWVRLVVCCAVCLCRCHRLVFYCLILCALMASVSDRHGL